MLVPVEQRVQVGTLCFHIDRLVVWRDWKPCVRVTGKSSLWTRRPLHGRAFAIATLLLGPAGYADGVLHILFARGSGCGHADLCSIVGQRRGAAGKQDSGETLRDFSIVHTV